MINLYLQLVRFGRGLSYGCPLVKLLDQVCINFSAVNKYLVRIKCFDCLQIEVTLVKDPTLGLGITGGIDGENSIKPGDTVSYL